MSARGRLQPIDATTRPYPSALKRSVRGKGDIEQAKFDFSTALTRAPGNFTTAKEAIAKARQRLDALESSARSPAASRCRRSRRRRAAKT